MPYQLGWKRSSILGKGPESFTSAAQEALNNAENSSPGECALGEAKLKVAGNSCLEESVNINSFVRSSSTEVRFRVAAPIRHLQQQKSFMQSPRD